LTNKLRIFLIGAFMLFSFPFALAGENLSRPCGVGTNASICFAPIDKRGKLSSKEKQMFVRAATLAIETVYSPEFENKLNELRDRIARQPTDSARWNKVRSSFAPLNNEKIVSLLRKELNGMELETYGYLKGTLQFWIWGTKAKDGGSGPIQINRAALAHASASSLANTFVHEAAHRIGLSHDEAKPCRSPYAIGDLVESMIEPSIDLICKFDV